MNLDDFIVPSSIGTPAGVSPVPSSAAGEEQYTSTTAAASAIPIKQQKRIQAEELQLSRASAPFSHGAGTRSCNRRIQLCTQACS